MYAIPGGAEALRGRTRPKALPPTSFSCLTEPVETEAVVGRDVELTALHEFVEAKSRLPAAAVIEGEAGIGKTTLWTAAVDLAREHSYRVLWCRPAPSETTLSFAGLRDLLDPYVPEVLDLLPSPQRRAVAVALLLDEPLELSPGAGEVAAGFLGILRALAAEGPVLVAVDDVQWLDTPTASVVEFVVRRLTSSPVALALSLRPDAGAPIVAELDRVLADDRLVRLTVGPLSMGGVHKMLRQHLGFTCARPLLRRVHEVSAGNPFFALELVRALQRSGKRLEPGTPLPVSSNLRQLVSERLAALGTDVQEVLLVVSALSEPTIEVVSKAVGSAEARAAAAAAAEAGVLHTDGERIGFAHPLLASGTYAEASGSRRLALHRKLAGIVDDPQERARHLSLSAERPDEAVAVAVEQAATKAWQRGASFAAAELTERAAELTPLELTDDALRRRIVAATYYFEAGDTAAATWVLEQVIAGSDGPIRAQAQCRLARILLFTDQLSRSAEAFRAAERDATDAAVRTEAEEGLAWNLVLMREDIVSAATHARAAIALAEDLGQKPALSEALGIGALAEFLLGHAGDSKMLMQRALSLGSATETLPRVLRHPGLAHGVVLTSSDDFDGARRVFRKLHERARERGDESALTRVLLCLSNVEFLSGNWRQAESYAVEAEQDAAQTGQYAEIGNMLYDPGILDAHLGRLRAARRRAERGLERTDDSAAVSGMVARRVLSLVAVAAGDWAAASQYSGELVDRFEDAGIAEPGVAPFYPDYIEALVALGRLDEAESILTRYQSRAERLGRLSALAAAWRCRGLLDAARSQRHDALSALETALRYHDKVTMPFERARTQLCWGMALRRAKQKTSAREALGEARAVFTELGARQWAERASTELSRIGGRAPASGALTPGEMRVAHHAAEGLTTKEIAAQLFVSAKTVEGHLSNVYVKLGIRSRAELAKRFAAGRLPTGS
jgi:DNA-binding CsgD family transcriptional regulator